MVTSRPLQTPGHLKVFLVAGEASGDAYGAMLVRQLEEMAQQRGWQAECVGWGGDAMAASGMKVLTHCNDINFMGFWEVAQNIMTIFKNLRRIQSDIEDFAPDVVVTIDFPGFNMRLAKRLRKTGHPAFRLQWVTPQIWAWKAGRTKALAQDFDVACPILPFENDLLSQAGVNTWNVGHPLLDGLDGSVTPPRDRPLALAMLPGSRHQELQHHLPILVEAARRGAAQGRWALRDVAIAGAPGKQPKDYQLAVDAGVDVVFGPTEEVLQRAQMAWVASGTATLEAALAGTPHVLVYRTSRLTYAVAKQLAKVPFIGLPNILLDRKVVPELIQNELTPEALLGLTLEDLAPQKKAFQEVASKLGGPGAAERLAQHLFQVLG